MPLDPDAARPAPTVVERSVVIRAAVDATWRAMMDPELGHRWLGGFRFVSSWEVGGPVSMVGTLNGEDYRDVGTVRMFEAGRVVQYDHWSTLWRVPDAPENRAVLTFSVEPEGEGTRVAIRHELPAVEALAQHSNFFWRGALEQLRRLVEG